MPYINIKIAKGRTREQKRTLVASVTEAVSSSIGVDPQKVWVQLDEFELDNFAIDGRLLIDRK